MMGLWWARLERCAALHGGRKVGETTEPCAVRYTLEGGPCGKRGTAEYYGELVCEEHARRFEFGDGDEGTRLEGIVFHLGVWLKRARREGDPEGIRDLEDARWSAVLDLHLARMWAGPSDPEGRIVANGVRGLVRALEAHHPPTARRALVVAELAAEVARGLGLPDEEAREVEQVALLHDVGKIAVPAQILDKPMTLGRDEWEITRVHPVVGARAVASIEGLSRLAPLVRAVRERWDGWGYPDGLSGEGIPLASRIVSVCAAYRAMVSDRPYGETLGHQAALEEIERNAGTQFCPRAVEALLAAIARACPDGEVAPQAPAAQAKKPRKGPMRGPDRD